MDVNLCWWNGGAFAARLLVSPRASVARLLAPPPPLPTNSPFLRLPASTGP